MSTYCALHIHADEAQIVVAQLEQYLARTHAGKIVKTGKENTFGPLYGNEFICSEEKAPTKFVVCTEQPGWYTAHFNSFLRIKDLAIDISGRLNTVVILVLVQTVSSSYHLTICRQGARLRTLEFADGEWMVQEGELLPFETEPLGKNISEPEDEPYCVFENDSVREYCEQFGLKLWTHQMLQVENPQYTVLRVQ